MSEVLSVVVNVDPLDDQQAKDDAVCVVEGDVAKELATAEEEDGSGTGHISTLADPTPRDPLVEYATQDERLDRMDAMLKRWVPNKDIWPQLRALQTPKSVFSVSSMPFKEKMFLSLKLATRSSIMFPYYVSMASVGASIYAALAVMFHSTFEDKEPEYLPLSIFLALLPMAFGFYVFTCLHEYACRVYLYHRLWEQKIVINFKSRTITHRTTLAKMGIIGVCVVGYIVLGIIEFGAKWSYYFVIVQAYGTVASVI